MFIQRWKALTSENDLFPTDSLKNEEFKWSSTWSINTEVFSTWRCAQEQSEQHTNEKEKQKEKINCVKITTSESRRIQEQLELE